MRQRKFWEAIRVKTDGWGAALAKAPLLRWALGIVYFHFGFLKFFADLSPAELLAEQTIIRLSLFWLDAELALRLLAAFECVIGLGFIFDMKPRWIFFLFLAHMAGTFTPIFLLPGFAFKVVPFCPTFEGQYILKNLVFVAAGWTVLYPRAFGGRRQNEEN